MPRPGSARRYAQAVFGLAIERSELDAWLEDLAYLARTLESEQFGEYLDSPQVSEERKAELIENTLSDRVSRLARNLLSLLASRSMTHILPGIVDQYQRLLDSHRGIERAEVSSAVPLDDGQRARVVELLKAIAGKEVRLIFHVEPQLLGGFVARVGDRVIDGSTSGRLRQLRRELVERRS
ncbi:MAG: ATP synthase F1 subunit delta [Chloroflexi bacterium]|nr:ATP synthase F1 subunit delta [Chloroflexota bacterium]